MFTIYRASAGSGKTFTLVKEYLRICLLSGDTEKYRHILAITFTNKACNEMKERIIRTLHGFSGTSSAIETDEKMLKLLIEETKKSEEEIRAFAKKMLHKILQDYSGLSISTIDSFIHKVIRSFAYELDIPHNFEVHLDKDELLNALVANVLNEVTEDEQQPMAQALIEFSESKIDEGKGWSIEFALREFAKELLREESYPYLEKVASILPEQIAALSKQLRKTTTEFEQKINAFGSQILDLIASQNLSVDDFFQKGKGIYSYYVKLKSFSGKDLELNSYAQKTYDEWAKGSEKTSRIDVIKNQLFSLTTEVLNYIASNEKQYYLAKLIAKNMYQLRVADAISRALQKVKDDKNILPIGEFQTIISKIVSEQDAPIIYERIGEKYDSILIDEFQDTSLLQFRNLLPLLENSQFKSADSLVVGDAKQSIYRFKGGEAQQIVALPKIYGSDTNQILRDRETAINNYKTKIEALDTNYRSRENIITFNNEFYAHIGNLEDYSKSIYENHAQKFLPQKTGGYVRIEEIKNQKSKIKNEEPVVAANVLLDDETDTKAIKNNRVLEIIEQVKTFGYEPSDVAILVRGNVRGAELAELLIHRGYAVETGESLLYIQSKEVSLLLALLQYLSDRNDKLYRYELLYQRGFADEKTFDAQKEVLRAPFYEFDKIFSFNSEELKQQSLFEICVAGIRLFNLNEESVFVSSFLDLVSEQQQLQNTLADFLSWWDEVKTKKSISQNSSANAVKIMTIHKSKGLEFPIVIIPDVDWTIKPTLKNVWVEDVPEMEVSPILLSVEETMEKTPYARLYQEEQQKSKSDTINLLYVATTRASERLYLLFEPSKVGNKITQSNYYLQKFLEAKPEFQNGVYEFGDNTTAKIHKTQEDGEKKRDVLSLSKRAELVLSRSNAANYVVKLKSTTAKTYNEEQLYGNKLHALISLMASSNNAALAKEKIALEDLNTATQLQTDIDFVLHHAALAPYFSDDYIRLSEFELLDEKKEIHKPDFVAIHKQTKEVAVLDFKSGKENEEYVKQVQRYASLLKAGNKNVTNAYLVYTQGKKIEAVTIIE